MARGYIDTAEVLERLRARAAAAGGIRSLAREWNISHAFISDVLRGDKALGDTLVERLGLEAVTLYRPASKS